MESFQNKTMLDILDRDVRVNRKIKPDLIPRIYLYSCLPAPGVERILAISAFRLSRYG